MYQFRLNFMTFYVILTTEIQLMSNHFGINNVLVMKIDCTQYRDHVWVFMHLHSPGLEIDVNSLSVGKFGMLIYHLPI